MLKVGDTIKCADKDDLVETHNILQRQGYDTDFLYEKDGKKRLVAGNKEGKRCRKGLMHGDIQGSKYASNV